MVSQIELNKKLIDKFDQEGIRNRKNEIYWHERSLIHNEVGSLDDWIQNCAKDNFYCDSLVSLIKNDRRDEVLPLVNRFKGMSLELTLKMIKDGMIRDEVVDEWRSNWTINRGKYWKELKEYGYENLFDEFVVYKTCREVYEGTRNQCSRAVDAVEAHLNLQEIEFPQVNPFEKNFDNAWKKQFKSTL